MRYALPLGFLAAAAFAWIFGSVASSRGAFGLGALFQITRCLGFALAAAAVWRLHWVRRFPLALGLVVAGTSDIVGLLVRILDTRGWSLVFEAVEAAGSAWLGWTAFQAWGSDEPGLYGLRGAVGLQTVTALRSVLEVDAFSVGNAIAVVGGVWLVAVARRHIVAVFAHTGGTPDGAARGA